jgi:hypothetical protein
MKNKDKNQIDKKNVKNIIKRNKIKNGKRV